MAPCRCGPASGGLRLVACISLAALPTARAAFSPVIGILTEPLDNHGYPGSYLEDWYVRWVEAQGARAVPIRYDAPTEETEALLARVNGVLFPGGGVSISPNSTYGRFGEKVFKLAVKDGMPMWGTCLGFEMFMSYSSGHNEPSPLTPGWDAEGLQLPLNLTAAGQTSALVADWPADLRRASAESNVTWNFHQSGVAVSSFQKSETLQSFWSVVATNLDRRGREFVSLVEARGGLPFFASQFHPEKNANEFEEPSEDFLPGGDPVHSEVAVDMAARLAQHFVGRARAFRRFGFTSEEFWRASIRAWPVQSAGQVKYLDWLPKHMQVYYFPPEATTSESLAELLV